MTENNNSSEKDTDGGDVMADIMKVTERQAVECLWKRVKMPLSILVLSGTGKTVYSLLCRFRDVLEFSDGDSKASFPL